MHTPLTTHAFSAATTSDSDPADALATPAVIVAGTRVSREMVRLFVASAFFALETVLRLGEFLPGRLLGRKRLS